MEETEEDFKRYYKKLVENIKWLCLPFKEQKEYLPDFTDRPFEVLDGYVKAFVLLPQLIDNRYLSLEATGALVRLYINVDFALCSPDFGKIPDDKMDGFKDWVKLNSLAKQALRVMNETEEKPDAFYI
ncbi:hypothetical protein Q763_07605 [Flavobacterium beibuense F44-8]|uniref:Uncharacterized protein n=1 Tax=Flavobacterium beibuense F44-8 TaxID=1406840 RepID=A0A0A2LNJ5_9FLAO|nr:hypothetical protein [Flavobacterium beibuense]KGO81504.1 hypothetical protein Q763_07605 [Flavobacterium beibuense F44-8]